MRSPTLLDSASMTTGRPGSKEAISQASELSKDFCEGCGSRFAPNSDPQWFAKHSKSTVWTPLR